jgi:hypothetical protein
MFDIFELIDGWRVATGKSDEDLGREAVGDSKAVELLKAGTAPADYELRVHTFLKRWRAQSTLKPN